VNHPSSNAAEQLIQILSALKQGALDLETCYLEHIDQAQDRYRHSARNLLHYISLRQNDIRAMQDDLAELGLTRLGRAEPHVMGSLDAVLATLHALAGRPVLRAHDPQQMRTGKALLAEHNQALLGNPNPNGAPPQRPPPTRNWSNRCCSKAWMSPASTARTTMSKPGRP
jgi:pyruvate kinase